jgi:predicted nucleic acid-binding protein
MTALVDTDVLVDILRGTPAAQAWLASVPTTAFAIPGVVAMELVVGTSASRSFRASCARSARSKGILCIVRRNSGSLR